VGTKGNDIIKRSINFDRWVFNAIEEISVNNNYTFTYALHELLRPVLKSEGYTSGIGQKFDSFNENTESSEKTAI